MDLRQTSLPCKLVLPLSLLAGALGFLAGCSPTENEVRFLADDFFVTVVTPDQKREAFENRRALTLHVTTDVTSAVTREECEANLRRAVCETTASTTQISTNYANIVCLPTSEQFLPALMEIYDETPALMRASLCSLERVFLSDNIPSTAFASSVIDQQGRLVGGYVGFKRATFLQQPTADALVTWKEQLAFGGSTDFLANDPQLLQISYGLKLSNLKSDGLFYVLMHELGHLIDFNNQINSSNQRPTEWSRLSWQIPGARPLPGATFLKRDEFCFYNCFSYLNPADAKAIYSSLQASAFITTYSSQSPWEDFAEFWTWHMMIAAKNPRFTVTFPGELPLEMNRAFSENPQLKTKLEFVDQLWNSPDLKVDNRPR